MVCLVVKKVKLQPRGRGFESWGIAITLKKIKKKGCQMRHIKNILTHYIPKYNKKIMQLQKFGLTK